MKRVLEFHAKARSYTPARDRFGELIANPGDWLLRDWPQNVVTDSHKMTQVLRISWTGWCSAMLLMGILVVLASLPPWVGEPVRIALMYGFDPLCHQIAERSPHVHGVQLAVCHRCYGILIGLAIGPVTALIIRGRGQRFSSLLIVASLVPLALDWGLGIVGIWANTAESRLITGAIFGVAAGILVANAMAWYRPSMPL